MGADDRIIGWNEFNAAVTGLNAKEAFSVALAISDSVRALQYLSWPFKRRSAQLLPELLMNYAYAQGNVDELKGYDPDKVKAAVNLIHGTRYKQANDYAIKLQGRVEFSDIAVLYEMPSDVVSMYGLALDDARDGSARGFAWSCFRLKQAFQRPSAKILSADDALDLHAALKGVPDMVVDIYGDAGFDVAVQMEKMHDKVGAMPMRPM